MNWIQQIRYFTLRSIQARSRRYFLSGFGILIGVATMLSIGITNRAALDSIVLLFENTSGKTQLSIVAAGGDQTGIPEQIQQTVENFPDIAVVAPSVVATTVLSSETRPSELSFGLFGTTAQGLQLSGIDPLLDPLMRDYTITEGSFFDERVSQKYEVVLVEDYAEDQSIQIGDWIGILSTNGIVQVQVIGLMAKEGPGQTNNGAFGILRLSVAQEIFNRQGELDQLDLVLIGDDPDQARLERVKQSLQTRLGSNISVTYPSAQGKRMTQMLQSYQIGLNFMSGIALFVGAFLIYNAFAMTVIERTREFGMLRTIGMTRRQVTNLVLLEAGILGALGSFLGLFAGILLARGLTSVMEVILNQELLGIEIPTENLVVSWLIGVVVTFFAAALPAFQAGRISPLEALRVRAKSGNGWIITHGWKVGLVLFGVSAVLLILNPFPYDVQFRLGSMTVFGLFGGATLLIPSTLNSWERIGRSILKGLFGSSGDLGSRNVQRSKQRTTLTVAALMVGVAMVIITRGMTESFAGDLREWINAYIGGDIYASSAIPMRSDIGTRIESIPEVQAVTPVRYLRVDWQQPDGEIGQIDFMFIEPASHAQVTEVIFSSDQLNPRDALSKLAEGGGVFISTVLAEKFSLKPGDLIQIRTRAGNKNFKIIAVVIDFYNQGLVVQGNWSDMRRYYRVNDASTFLVKVEPGQSVDAVMERIDNLYGQRYNLILESNLSIRNRISILMDQAFSMFDVMAMISIVVGSLGIVNTLTMSVIERTREIGMLRAIGMTRSQIIRMILAEAGLMGVLGGVLGLFTGSVLARIIFIGMTTMSGYELTFVLPPEGIAVSFAGAVVISLMAAVFPARRAARIEILEAVRYE